jgi:hypothetical protein
MLDPNDSTLLRATHILRSAWTATMLFDESPFETKCMIDPKTGSYIVAIVDDALSARDITLASPRDSFDSRVRLAVDLSSNVSEEQSDRFTAYHLPATTPLLAVASYEYAKLDSGEVVTPENCPLVNPLVSVMGPLCKALNQDRDRLSRLCEKLSGVEHESPLAVGVDDTGIDIRASFGLVRLKLPSMIPSPETALDSINTLLGSCDA